MIQLKHYEVRENEKHSGKAYLPLPTMQQVNGNMKATAQDAVSPSPSSWETLRSLKVNLQVSSAYIVCFKRL